jgi:phenylpropionate dioxygenase-like ring-hydroxylating dioxygenase large terminal subunit
MTTTSDQTESFIGGLEEPKPALTYQDLLDADTRAVPESLRWLSPGDFGSGDVPVARYLDRRYHELEKERLWSKVWQWACREEEIPEVGDTAVYDIVDTSIVIVRTAPGPDGIRAYYNACLHRGRALRDCGGRVKELRCAFHGFCWSLEGELTHVPAAWDFPQVEADDMHLPEVKVGTWGGFVLINMDPECEPLETYLGSLPELFERWPLEERYTQVHVAKVVRANWKLLQEAFMESYHVVTTHPQLLPGFGDANSQYDVFGNVARAVSASGTPSPHLSWEPTPQEMFDSIVDRREDEIPLVDVPEGTTARAFAASLARESLRPLVGDEVEALSDAEMIDSLYFTVFPNFHPWGAYNRICYRFRPHGDDHTEAIMEVLFLSPFTGERPPPSPVRWLGPDEEWTTVPELGGLARVFDQDDYNLEQVQKGLRTTVRKGVRLGVYQESKIRHFHHLYETWVGD